jgi:hypothetical protein
MMESGDFWVILDGGLQDVKVIERHGWVQPLPNKREITFCTNRH